MRGRDRSLGGAVVSLLGAVLALAPLFDIWDDVANPPFKSLPSTLLENSVLLVLALVLVAGGLWLVANDWQPTYVRTAVVWYLLGTAVAAGAVGWVAVWQLLVQGGLKPFVLAADAVVIGSIGALAVGVDVARRRMKQDALEAERDRLAALFENTSDAVAAVEFDDGTPVVTGINSAFAETFGVDPGAAPGERIDALLVPDDAESEARTLNREALAGENVEREVVRRTPDGERTFLLRVVPYDAADGARRAFASYTDVTDRRELDRAREQRNKVASLHDHVSRLQRVDGEAEAYAVATEAVRDVLDADAAALAHPGDGTDGAADVGDGGDDGADGRPRDGHDGWRVEGDPDAYLPDLVERAREAGVSVTAAGVDGYDTVVAAPGERAVIGAATAEGGFAEGDERVLELLADHVSESIERVRSQRVVERERERLEFMNRILRHNLLNGLNVVDARLEMLEGEVDESVATHRDTAADRVRNMTELIETMRTFMQVIVEDEEHELGAVDLASTVEEELDAARGAFPDAEFAVEGSLPDVAVRADALLPEVFENLLTNAVRHNDKDVPRVVVSATDHGETVTVEVADNGPGVPDDRKGEIFDKGIKGLQSPGSGFGLYLVREIVDSYGGDVTVEDNEPEGARFRLTLPAARADGR